MFPEMNKIAGSDAMRALPNTVSGAPGGFAASQSPS
jgi:hypothetical protein